MHNSFVLGNQGDIIFWGLTAPINISDADMRLCGGFPMEHQLMDQVPDNKCQVMPVLT